MEWIDTTVWVVSYLLVAAGFLGIFIPALPGPFLMTAGILLHKIFLPQISWWTVGLAVAITIIATIIDWICIMLGVKWSGASKWGMWGAGIGFIVGMIALNIIGIFIGTVLGAMAGELYVAQRHMKAASIAGMAAVIGMVASAAARVALGLVLVLVFMMDCFVF